jgi:tetratricopeptide (TPR) repeat protein
LSAFIEGLSAVRQEKYKAAIELLNKALKDPSREAVARFWIGFSYLETGDLKKAICQYHLAIKLEPDNTEFLLHLGSALYLNGQPKKSMIIYNEILRLDPKNKNARDFLKILNENE